MTPIIGWIFVALGVGYFLGHAVGYFRARQSRYWDGVRAILEERETFDD